MGQAASRAALTSTMKKRCGKRTALAFGMGAQAARCMDSCEGLTLIAVGSEVASDFAALNPGYLL